MGQTLDRSKIALIVSLSLWTTLACGAAETFRFSIKSEPTTMDPASSVGGESAYFRSQLYRGLTRFDGTNQLIFDLAKKCRFKTETELHCELRKEARWSDGSAVVAQDFVDTFRHLVSSPNQSPVLPLLFTIKNAKEIVQGKLEESKLGVQALSPNLLKIELVEKDTEFLEKLSNPLLAAYKKDKTNGPYKIKSWMKKEKITLEPFDDYFGGSKNRPVIEIYFAAEDSAAMTLYEKGVINFLTRLTTINIPKYKDRKDFFQVPVARYDYLGFNLRPGSPFEKKEVRQALAHALNFQDFKKAFFALGAPGCPGLGEPFLNPDGHCVDFEDKTAKLDLKPIKFIFSQMGGDDIKRQAEWFQSQWRDHLGVKLDLQGMDQKQMLDKLAHNPPDSFRTGVPLNRPSCQAALERFVTGHPDNYVGFSNNRFDKLVKALSKDKLSLSEKESVCGVASDILFKEEYVGVPLGRIHFSMMMDPHFKGWTINELNQLDLSLLTYIP